jgi:hypothetical protein
MRLRFIASARGDRFGNATHENVDGIGCRLDPRLVRSASASRP